MWFYKNLETPAGCSFSLQPACFQIILKLPLWCSFLCLVVRHMCIFLCSVTNRNSVDVVAFWPPAQTAAFSLPCTGQTRFRKGIHTYWLELRRNMSAFLFMQFVFHRNWWLRKWGNIHNLRKNESRWKRSKLHNMIHWVTHRVFFILQKKICKDWHIFVLIHFFCQRFFKANPDLLLQTTRCWCWVVFPQSLWLWQSDF